MKSTELPDHPIFSMNSTRILILFGGVYLTLQGVTRYFAYVALPEQSASRPTNGSFVISNRNANGYTIVSGSIAKHAAGVGQRLWRNAKFGGPTVVRKSSEIADA